ncbi:hypothetical protein [Myroides odoratus]|uniref:hypothetical protein n=1 Tax=Myroides odoratus TaxID=256 RepID=UPI00333FBC3D
MSITTEYRIDNIVKYKGKTVVLDNELLGKHLLGQLDEPFEPVIIGRIWLNRLGFRKFHDGLYTTLNRNLIISNNDKTFDSWRIHRLGEGNALGDDIKYVHEIQNAISHIKEFLTRDSVDIEIEILGAKLIELSPLDQHITILKKQIELCNDKYNEYPDQYKAQQVELLSILEGLELKKQH